MTDEQIFVVDRIEGSHVVLVDDNQSEEITLKDRFPFLLREGLVLRVRKLEHGLDWASARADKQEEIRRLEEVNRNLARLRRTDPGGNIEL